MMNKEMMEMMEMMNKMMQTMQSMMVMNTQQSTQEVPSFREASTPQTTTQKPKFQWTSPVIANFRLQEVGTGRKKSYVIVYGTASKTWKSWTAPSKLAEEKVSEAVSGRNGWSKVDTPYQKKDGTIGTLSRWGHSSKAEAEEVLKGLPKGFMPATLNSYKPKEAEVDYSDFI